MTYKEYAKAHTLVRQAAFGAIQEVAAKRGLGSIDMTETLATAARLE